MSLYLVVLILAVIAVFIAFGLIVLLDRMQLRWEVRELESSQRRAKMMAAAIERKHDR